MLMPTLARRPNNKKKPNNIEDNKGEELAKLEENHYTRMAGIMVHGLVRYSKSPKGSKRAQGNPKKEVVNP